MRKIILMGRSECGKTSLRQALQGESVVYQKTQYIDHFDVLIDTPGEYAENHTLGRALALYSYEADVVGLVASATESYTLYAPNITCMVNRDVIGIVTKIDKEDARPDMAEGWLREAGCTTVFRVSSVTRDGIAEVLDYLRRPLEKQEK
jgi:ethanolamine utilization protein EutP